MKLLLELSSQFVAHELMVLIFVTQGKCRGLHYGFVPTGIVINACKARVGNMNFASKIYQFIIGNIIYQIESFGLVVNIVGV